MKIALYGNICNNFYTLAKALRKNLNIDAHLYLHDKVDIQNLPESDDPELLNNYPEWIHVSPSWNTTPFLYKWDKTFIRELNKYDVVFVSDMGVALTPFLKAKTLFYVTGADLTQIPFPKKYTYRSKGLIRLLAWEYKGYLQRRGIRKVTKILSAPFFPFQNALSLLKIDTAKVSNCYFPVLIDTENIKIQPNAWKEIDNYNKEQLKEFNFILFHPSRLVIQKTQAFVDAGLWKGNDVLFEAFGIFLKKYNITDACIAMPDRKFSLDSDLARKRINELRIENNIVWLKPPTPEGFPRNQLINFYSVANLVADEFATGWFGSVVIEGLACGKPTLCYVDEQVMEKLYPWHPILSSNKPEVIAEQIASFYFDKGKQLSQGELSRKWAEEFHSINRGTQIYLNNFKKDLQDIIPIEHE